MEIASEKIDQSNLKTLIASQRLWMSRWLLLMCGLVVLMVLVGGATRLTDSGLSITEWKPVTGAIPPLNLSDWESEFAKYKEIPEYEIVNKGMSLNDFKTIYWWEWAHRFLGRLIGLAFFLPLVIFVVRGWVSPKLGLKFLVLLILGGAQGALGWYMVKSGLTDRVDVSQYRLAAHMGMAVLLLGALFWVALELRHPNENIQSVSKLGWGGVILAVFVLGQIILGAFVAGLRAGHTFNTWPLMDGKFIPDGYFVTNPRLMDLFETIPAVQFNHRLGAYILTIVGIFFFIAARKTPLEISARLVLVAIIVQLVLGIATLLSATPIGLGLLHQAGALFVFLCALHAAYRSRISISN